MAFGAANLKVTVLSEFTSGDTILEPPQRACCANVLVASINDAATAMIFLIVI